jgi:hypothetical protein
MQKRASLRTGEAGLDIRLGVGDAKAPHRVKLWHEAVTQGKESLCKERREGQGSSTDVSVFGEESLDPLLLCASNDARDEHRLELG